MTTSRHVKHKQVVNQAISVSRVLAAPPFPSRESDGDTAEHFDYEKLEVYSALFRGARH